MRYSVLFALLLIVSSATAQTRCKGRVIDRDKNAIPFAVIQMKEKEGITCTANGGFSFFIPDTTRKKLVVYALGYKRKEVMVDSTSKDSLFIELVREELALDEVTIKTKKKRIKSGVLGYSNLDRAGGYYMSNGDEIAIFLKKKRIPAKSFLKDVFLYITDEGKPSANFMVHVYLKDSATNWPGKEITSKMAHGEKGNEWVQVDFSDKRIPVKDVLLISMEWIAGNGNDDSPSFQGNTYQRWSRNSNEEGYNGQVLGSTNDYGIMDITFHSRRSSERNHWWYNVVPNNQKHKWFNPMIYCTYTYSK